MWFKHPAWIPVSWLLSAVNIGAVWVAAMPTLQEMQGMPGMAGHATAHALLAVLFAIGAQRLTYGQRGLNADGSAELPSGATLAALREGDSETLQRVERAVEAIAVELERVGEGQRFITKVLTDAPRALAEPEAKTRDG